MYNKSNMICKIGEWEHLEALQKGQLFLWPIQYHIQNAKDYPELNYGDAEEAFFVKGKGKATIQGIEFATVDIKKSSIKVHCPIFCAFEPDWQKTNEGKYTYIPDKRLQNDFMREKNKKYGVILIEKYSFIKKCAEYFEKERINCYCGNINYTDDTGYSRLEPAINCAFKKRKRFAYQKEFRLLIDTEHKSKEPFIRNIGDLSQNSQIIEADKFFSGNGIILEYTN